MKLCGVGEKKQGKNAAEIMGQEEDGGWMPDRVGGEWVGLEEKTNVLQRT